MPWLDSDAAELAFYRAFSELDLETMGELWSSNGQEAYCVHPGGPLIFGHEAILRSWASIFSGSAPPQIRFECTRHYRDGAMAVHIVTEYIRAGDGAHETAVVATNIYRETADGWRMLAHHAGLPIVVDPETGHGTVH